MAQYAPMLDGQYLFGTQVVMHYVDQPRAKQVNAFVGIDGVEVLDLGFRQATIEVRGTFWGYDSIDVATQINILKSYRNAFAYQLQTTKGEFYAFAQVHAISEVPPLRFDAGSNQYFQSYTCTIWIL